MTRVPSIIDPGQKIEYPFDLYSRLLRDRIVFIGDEITMDLANSVLAQLMFLESEDAKKDILVIVNSPGGDLYGGLAIYDSMQAVKPDVRTCCVGMAASAGSLILTGGSKGKRYALPNARIMIHQPWGGMRGKVSDVEIQAREMLNCKRILNEIYVKHTGKTMNEIEKDTDRDKFMQPGEAADYGLIDEVITTLPRIN
jgi:ATP-dependent Clp protease protease subunit